MTIQFGYEKAQVLAGIAVSFYFQPEIRIMMILVNVFALASVLYLCIKKITPMAFFTSSSLWIVLMISFWFILPGMVYQQGSNVQT